MYSRGIFGSCFWKRVFSPVSKIKDFGCMSFSTGMILITPFRSSTAEGFSVRTGG